MSDPLSVYLAHYPQSLQAQILALDQQGQLPAYLQQKYGNNPHSVQSDALLYQYVEAYRQQMMRQSSRIHKVGFSGQLEQAHQALGIHRQVRRAHGNSIKKHHEIWVSAVFKQAPEAFLEMIVVHELAHLREMDHNKAFYRLCSHMMPDYHQTELDMRIWLMLQSRKSI